MFSRTLLFVFCDVVRLERKAVADSQNGVERLLDCIGLEFGTLLVRVDFLVLFPVLHKLEINAVMIVDFPLDADGSHRHHCSQGTHSRSKKLRQNHMRH